MYERTEGLFVTIGADVAPLRAALTDASRLGRGFGKDLGDAFEGAAIRGRSLSDTVRSLAQSLSQRTLNAAFAPFERAIGNQFAGLFGGLLGQARITPFAKGGVISSPVGFPLGPGMMGLAGEAGPEAVLPLRRASDGSLGVVAGGGGRPVSVTVNIATQDAASFRRSEGQVAAMLSRAVGRGSRNL
jgi:phage-related minor tail protein